MKKLIWNAWLWAGALSAMACLPAHAAVVTFDDVAPNLFGPGDSFVSGGMSFAVPAGPFQGVLQPGFGLVDTSATLSTFSNAPTGNATQFYAGLNDNFLVMMSEIAPSFRLTSFSFGFIPPVTVPNGLSPGAIFAFWTDIFGAEGVASFDFGIADMNGDWAFRTASFGPSAPAAALRTVTVAACLYGANNACFWPASNQAQFAIDNIDFNNVPLPSSVLLAGLGLAALAVTRRRAAR